MKVLNDEMKDQLSLAFQRQDFLRVLSILRSAPHSGEGRPAVELLVRLVDNHPLENPNDPDSFLSPVMIVSKIISAAVVNVMSKRLF